MNNGKICISICAERSDDFAAQIREAEKMADFIEIRFDCLDPDRALGLLADLPDTTSNYLFTYRPMSEGGRRDASREERIRFWTAVSGLSRKDFLADLESDIVTDSVGVHMSKIGSFHDFSGVSEDLPSKYDALAKTGAKAVKIAVAVNKITDAIPVWNLFQKANEHSQNIIPIAMGEAGEWTRILGLAHGAFLTYASLSEGSSTAPGQFTVKDLIDTYRVKDLDRETKVFGVIGDPVSQSQSPYMHNPAFAATGFNGVFMRLLVSDLGEFITRMVKPETREVELNFGGFSVTMPHKQAIIPHLDAIHPVAAKIGAVNTVKIADDGKMTGYNTDAHGFIAPLSERFGDLKDAKVAVFGTGGAARACVYSLQEKGCDITVYARDPKKAVLFGEEFKLPIQELPTDDRPAFDILVDATPMGMKGPLQDISLFTAKQLKGVRFVYDLVTRPDDTPLIAEAKKAGIPAIGGLEMLIAQGARQFEIWTGKTAPVELMRGSILKRIQK